MSCQIPNVCIRSEDCADVRCEGRALHRIYIADGEQIADFDPLAPDESPDGWPHAAYIAWVAFLFLAVLVIVYWNS